MYMYLYTYMFIERAIRSATSVLPYIRALGEVVCGKGAHRCIGLGEPDTTNGSLTLKTSPGARKRCNT